jgi:hypothetical protein
MLTIIVPGEEYFNDSTQEFFTVGDVEIKFEHSLVSLSKWESIYEKPFLAPGEKTSEEILEYIKCMLIDSEIPSEVFSRLSEDNISKINDYISAKMSATWFNERPGQPGNKQVITAEVIYHWMITFQIPLECQYWHLNRLFTLIRVCNAKNTTPKKMGRNEVASRMRDLNAKRRLEMGTRG